ncbi:MAG TPA: lipoprotein LpqH [Mycobacterium sp.]|nr:lipoprotein LpqH [Mycobacterium sp.]
MCRRISGRGTEVIVNNRFIAGASALVVACGVAGCSDPAPAARPAGGLPAGTAEVSINGAGAGRSNAVNCSTVGPVTTINTGNESSGTTSTIDTRDGLAVQFAQITDVGGFTGSYWAHLGPDAKVDMTGQTFVVTGSATGFNVENPSARATEDFSIRVAC